MAVLFIPTLPATKKAVSVSVEMATYQALAEAAVLWWRLHRPLGWGETQHLDNPAINCMNAGEGHLAVGVARLVALRQQEA